MFVVKLSILANCQNPKMYTPNKTLGCAPKTYNSAISLRKKHDISQNYAPFLSLLLLQKRNEKNHILMLSFHKFIFAS